MSYDFLKQSLYLEHLSPVTVGLLLVVAFVLGAIHALSPGHGKSLMAAYLVGTHGKLRDVLVLGFTITISHVFSVVVLGLIALWLEDFFLPGTVSLYFSLGSAILILLIGVWLFISRWKSYRAARSQLEPNIVPQDAEPPAVTAVAGEYSPHLHHSSSHTHSHAHHHHHFDRRLSFWENVVLGVSGGIVPCPKALVILLLAISLQKIGLGLAIIAVFSLGLASVLVALGIIVIRSGNILESRWNDHRIQLIPVFGALVVISLGMLLLWQTLGQFG